MILFLLILEKGFLLHALTWFLAGAFLSRIVLGQDNVTKCQSLLTHMLEVQRYGNEKLHSTPARLQL